MIINLRGTHGSGKSTIVKELLNKFDAEPLMAPGEKKPQGYVMNTPWGELRAVGSYETACGGCDAIQPYDLIWPRVELYAQHGHVIFEGALISSCHGKIVEASKCFGDSFIYAFLNTPLEVCLARIKKRRAEKGNTKPLDSKNTKSKFDFIQRSYQQLSKEHRVAVLDYRKPVPTILGLLKNG